MEQLVVPLKPTSPLAKVPYVGRERYDGLPFLEYATRKGKVTIEPPPKDETYVPLQTADRRFPPSASEQEPFFQTWLFFGLMSEFFNGNVAEESQAAQDVSNPTLDFLYDNFVYEEEGRKYVTTAKFILIAEDLIAQPDKEIESVEELKSRLSHLSICVRYASSILMSCSVGFNPDVKLSIAAMGESIMWLVASSEQKMGMDLDSFCLWGRKSMSSQMRQGMLQHGWCPSDITKCVNTFTSIQAQHLVSKIDRSLPPRDHSNCTDRVCRAGQIDMKNYHVEHVSPDCDCEPLSIDSKAVIEVLEKKDLVPVLKIYGGEGQLSDLKIDVVESATNEYVAISHVWVDGLGNPFANSLYRCQFSQLKQLIKGIPTNFYRKQEDGAPTKEDDGILLWLDTLCCPIGPPDAKKKALEKIRNAYEGAAIVLVLDSSLMAYSVSPMNVFEAFARIITSGWTRRLWTLQEGALARKILFQFGDIGILLDFLYVDMAKKYEAHVCHRGLILDLKKETNMIRSFFYHDRYGGTPADLSTIDTALKHRSVSVASDEALCIGTLMSLDTTAILSVDVPEEERMRVVWDQIVKSKDGVPSAIIFFTEPRLDIAGMRWAPTSILGFEQGTLEPIARTGIWKSPRSEYIESLGLQVRYPGFRISPQIYDDGFPHDPWPGSLKDKDGRPARIVDSFNYFRTKENQWFHFFSQETYANGRLTTTEEERVWKPDMDHPIYDISSTGRCALLLQRIPNSQHDFMNVHTNGLIVGYRENVNPKPTQTEDREPVPLHVRAEGHVIVSMCRPSEILMISTAERLATQLRGSELTRRLCNIADKEGVEYNEVMDELKAEMKRLMKAELDKGPELAAATNANHADFLNDLWKFVANWYRQDVFHAERLPDDQVWVVD